MYTSSPSSTRLVHYNIATKPCTSSAALYEQTKPWHTESQMMRARAMRMPITTALALMFSHHIFLCRALPCTWKRDACRTNTVHILLSRKLNELNIILEE